MDWLCHDSACGSTGFTRAGFNRAKFAKDGTLRLYTVVNRAGEGHILLWEQVIRRFFVCATRHGAAMLAPGSNAWKLLPYFEEHTDKYEQP